MAKLIGKGHSCLRELQNDIKDPRPNDIARCSCQKTYIYSDYIFVSGWFEYEGAITPDGYGPQ